MDDTTAIIPVRWEACGAYTADHTCVFASCTHCGWPAHDHPVERPVELALAS